MKIVWTLILSYSLIIGIATPTSTEVKDDKILKKVHLMVNLYEEDIDLEREIVAYLYLQLKEHDIEVVRGEGEKGDMKVILNVTDTGKDYVVVPVILASFEWTTTIIGWEGWKENEQGSTFYIYYTSYILRDKNMIRVCESISRGLAAVNNVE